MATNYKNKALQELSSIGFTISFLIENYSNQLGRLRLLSDMGQLDAALREPRDDEHPLQVAAQHIIRRACKLPVVLEYHGIPFPELPNAYRYLIEKDPSAIKKIPSCYYSDELVDYAVSIAPRILGYLPKELRTANRCEIATARSPYEIENVPKQHITHEMIMRAVEQDGYLIRHVYDAMLTEEIILKAIENSRFAIKVIPQKMLSRQAYETAVQNHSDMLKHIPKDHLDYNLCMIAIRHCGDALYSVPEAFYTNELFLAAIQSYPLSLDYIPEPLRTEELKLLALSLDIRVIDLLVPSEGKRLLDVLEARKANQHPEHSPNELEP